MEFDATAKGPEPNRGCIFCRSGKEPEVVQRCALLLPELRVIAPTKTRYRRVGGEAREERVALLPGYVFFETGEAFAPRELTRLDSVLRLLTYANGEWRLHGDDDRFARMLFKADGEIGLSRVCYDEGNRIRVLDGFMKECEGSIVRVNRRAKTAEVRIDFQDKRISMWLGFELIEKLEPSEKG